MPTPEPTEPPRWTAREAWAVATLTAGALAVRAIGLAWLPNPAGDEGNWAWLAWRLSRGLPASLDSNAAFVSMGPSHAMAWGFRVFGPGYGVARALGVAAIVSSVPVVYTNLRRVAAPRAAAMGAFIIAFHPWPVLWSRTAAVPYALGLAFAVAGASAWAAGLAMRSPRRVALALMSLAFSIRFSPLFALVAMSCVSTLALASHRWPLRTTAFWAGVVGATALAAPVVFAASRVSRSLPPRSHFDHLGARVANYLFAVGNGATGEATVRHFSGVALPPAVSWVCVVALVGVLLVVAGRTREGLSSLFATSMLATALVGTPFVLAAGRDWQLAKIDTDRYAFVLVPGVMFAVVALASHRARRARWVAGVWVLFGLVATTRTLVSLAASGHADHGLFARHGGGGYRGWQPPRERRAIAELLRETLDTHAPRGGTLVYADWALHTVHLFLRDERHRAWPVGFGPTPRDPHDTYLFALWPDEVFAADFAPDTPRRENDALRRSMRERYPAARRVRLILQPDGRPLLELWLARDTSSLQP